MTWPSILLSVIKGTREFGLPWNSGLNKVYRSATTWCYAAYGSQHAFRASGHSGPRSPLEFLLQFCAWASQPAGRGRRGCSGSLSPVLGRPVSLSFLAAAGGPGALSVLPALNRSPLGPLGQDEGSKQAPGWQRSWTPAPPRWANPLLIRAAIGARRAPGPPARPPWQLTAASPPGGRTPVASASHPRVRKHPVLGTPRENQLFAKDSVPFVDG